MNFMEKYIFIKMNHYSTILNTIKLIPKMVICIQILPWEIWMMYSFITCFSKIAIMEFLYLESMDKPNTNYESLDMKDTRASKKSHHATSEGNQILDSGFLQVGTA